MTGNAVSAVKVSKPRMTMSIKDATKEKRKPILISAHGNV